MSLLVRSDYGSREEFLSPNLALIESGGHCLVYDRLRGGALVLGGEGAVLITQLLRCLSSGPDDVTLDSADWDALLSALRKKGFLWPTPQPPYDNRLDRDSIAKGFFTRQLSLMVALDCNYACKDCFVFNEKTNILPRRESLMDWDTAEEALTKFFALRSTVPMVDKTTVRIFGGEPLLNWTLVSQIIGWIRERETGCRIFVTTNGSLLDRSRAAFFAKNGVTVFLSLNGLESVNDRLRVDHGGRGTFRQTIDGLLALMQESQQIHISLTVQDDDAILGLPEFIAYLEEIRLSPDQPITIYLSLLKGQVGETQFRRPLDELCEIVSAEWIAGLKRKIYLAGRFFHCFHNVFQIAEHFDRWCERGSGIVVYPSGEIRPCSGGCHVMGHIRDLQQALSGQTFRLVSCRVGGQIAGCRGCEVEGLCGGSCACSSQSALGEYRPGINCDFERSIFREAVKRYLSLQNVGDELLGAPS
jgi:uncharacterized protein